MVVAVAVMMVATVVVVAVAVVVVTVAKAVFEVLLHAGTELEKKRKFYCFVRQICLYTG